jgi:hypothetical protein
MNSLNDLRNALLHLKPTGEDGFEGLMAAVLSEICGISFRLASSGDQRGKDAEALDRAKHIAFEGKLYSGTINKNEVLSKLIQMQVGGVVPDLWILGATIAINSQLNETITVACEGMGCSCLILDWLEHDQLSPLAIVCVLASEKTNAFLRTHITAERVPDATERNQLLEAAATAIKDLSPIVSLSPLKSEILQQLSIPTLGLPLAVKRNSEFLTKAFSDRRSAMSLFGQKLSPNAAETAKVLPRLAVTDRVRDFLTSAPEGNILAILGGEGSGKSWAYAKSYLVEPEKSLTAIIPASDLSELSPYVDCEKSIKRYLISQSGENPDDPMVERRWNRMFERFSQIHPKNAKLNVYVDGLNERPGLDWSRWIAGAMAFLDRVGGRLVISSRKYYFDRSIKGVIPETFKIIDVPEFTDNEVREVIQNVAPGKPLSHEAVQRLKNPRILGLATDLFEDDTIDSFEELSIQRLLFEHLRRSTASRTVAHETPGRVQRRLMDHAKATLEHLQGQSAEQKVLFDTFYSKGSDYELSSELLAV